jgi:hypothetical protein
MLGVIFLFALGVMQKPGELGYLSFALKQGFAITGCLALNIHQCSGINGNLDGMLQTVSEIVIEVIVDKPA